MTGETVYVNGVPVGNVLVEPGQARDVKDIAAPAGAVIAYTLRMPAAYDGPQGNAEVVVRGHRCRTVGFADHLRPGAVFGDAWALPWDMTMAVELVEGEMTAHVLVTATSATVDELGDPVRNTVTVYEGPAQARMASEAGGKGLEHPGDVEALSRETWHFVLPWRAEFGAYRPQQLSVWRDGAEYRVESVANIGDASEHADIEAVRHG